jgi:poly(A) polymerase
MQYTGDQGSIPPITTFFPKRLWDALCHISEQRGSDLYISGGTVRDWLLGKKPVDLDITVQSGAAACCRQLISVLGSGAFVMLGTEMEEAARVVWQENSIDFSSFRKGAQSIEEELHHRDFTINSMAIPLGSLKQNNQTNLIDPLDGREALKKKCLHCCPEAFEDDPLRMLRAYRLQAEFGFSLSAVCVEGIQKHRISINNCAAERILRELERIMQCSKAAEVCQGMAATGLLWCILPELEDGVGVEQPGYHHEDVFNHSLLALSCVDRVIQEPAVYFGEYADIIVEYLQSVRKRKNLRLAALLHDLGKPATRSSGRVPEERITFYNHDRTGKAIFEKIAARLRMSRADTDFVGKAIEMHMHPFHLSNVRRKDKLSRRALLRICKKAGDELPGLFVLAMADSLAGQGVDKPEHMEEELAELFGEITEARRKYIDPALHGKKLLSGYDLIEKFNLQPGPVFRRIFSDLEIAQVEGEVMTREGAMVWLRQYLDRGQKK